MCLKMSIRLETFYNVYQSRNYSRLDPLFVRPWYSNLNIESDHIFQSLENGPDETLIYHQYPESEPYKRNQR